MARGKVLWIQIAGIAICQLAACSSVPKAELAWQAVHAVDVAQTVQIGGSRCAQEDDAVTRRLIGLHPSRAGAAAWGVGTAALHAGVTAYLEHIDAPKWIKTTWQSISIVTSADMVAKNFDNGINPVSGRDCNN